MHNISLLGLANRISCCAKENIVFLTTWKQSITFQSAHMYTLVCARTHTHPSTCFSHQTPEKIDDYDVKDGLLVHDPLKYKIIKIYLASDLQSNVESEASWGNRPSEDLSDLVQGASIFCLFKCYMESENISLRQPRTSLCTGHRCCIECVKIKKGKKYMNCTTHKIHVALFNVCS